MSGARRLGSADEDAVADMLLSLGWTLLGRRVKTKSGELDVVALDGDTLVIVEVRRREGLSTPEESVTSQKIERLYAASQEYIAKNGLQGKMVRFDLVAIQQGEIRHHRDALRL